ncbi:MAG TPA: permease [candidate division WOR-3 bacterium]|uniref:Permease n=1 Tax=candidate division WOR-3 bacterium TaxID=2052148 RepID=A0A7V0T801_UNCW3|nr:permease [candidate division WOR-3 bacterium]
MKERWKFLLILAAFLLFFFLPVELPRVQGALLEGFLMLQDYARLHVLLCLVPAFFIAGAIQNFISKEAVLKYFGPKSNKFLAYSVASVSGAILAVCSCTVLPMFMGIYYAGAGLGVATTFLYSGPAINVLAILMTGRVLGLELGAVRAIGAVIFSVVVGLGMALIFLKSERQRAEAAGLVGLSSEPTRRNLGQNILYFAAMILFLVFANWGQPAEPVGFFNAVFAVKWYLAGAFLLATLAMTWRWFSGEERKAWVGSTWTFAKQILPLLLGGVFVAGVLLGRPGENAGIIPDKFIAGLVGGNSLWANLFASLSGALMYFATLTEIPILQGLLGSGMGKGPALALLLSGPALSLPSMIIILRTIGAKRTLAFIGLVVILSTVAGLIYGML